ncbi:E3 ubiquitin-protein ligase LRSAM1-like [Achroia grisella]|uniref:E3 ubiquitin-protein ligase LRSAM1-like n=1 Tax=Achroia grisella TaxID=688607 RepID=UPI0027D2BD33|nr:E3 ubiquitin-protein ligase LRSAM1-like [Achroia grisella]
MGCAVSCVTRTKMLLFGKHSNNTTESRAKLERKLYLAKESPEPDFDLSDCELRHVPSGIYSICKVYRKDHLYLHCNSLHSLEDGGQLSDLYGLKVLNISSNNFTQLSSDIKYLVNLTELYIQENNLKTLPDSIEFLQSLQILNVSKNRLKTLTPSLGKLKALRNLDITKNNELKELCSELCFATNIISIKLDSEQFIFPPTEVAVLETSEIMAYLCKHMNVDYIPPLSLQSEIISVQSPSYVYDPFLKYNTTTWEEEEAAKIEQENKFHEAAKQQREKFLIKILQDQQELDSEIARIHEAKDQERQKLLKAIQDDEREVECLVTNFIQSDLLKPEILQQQLIHEQAEHDRLLEIARQNYDNIRKADVLKAMEALIEEDYSIKHSKKHYEDSVNDMKQSILVQEMEGAVKMEELLNAKDQSRTVLVQQLLEDEDIQKALVASLIERVDARSWSLNQEIGLISLHLARLSVIEQEKKKLQISCNYNELLQQRMQLVFLLDDLMEQRNKRRKQLIDTLKEMENQHATTTDFWLKNYQKLIDSAPKNLLEIGKQLDPVLANYLLQEGVMHCLPFLVKFLFSDKPLLKISLDDLKENGVSLSSDRKAILRAINYYVIAKSQVHTFDDSTDKAPSAPTEEDMEQNCTGVVTSSETEDSVLESECVICMDAKCEVIFIPCGHMCCCQSCIEGEKKVESCPLCRDSIERIIKVRVA